MITYLLLLFLFVTPPANGGFAARWTDLRSSVADVVLHREAKHATGSCGSDLAGRGGIQESHSPQLRELAEYETVCQARFADATMLFSPMPTSVTSAAQQGRSLAKTLKEFDSFSVEPLLILEPTTTDENIVPIASIAAGTYDTALTSFFQSLKDNGVSDGMMGMWVLMPEANTPVWGSTDPVAFGTAVSKIASIQKQRFPTSQTSILLASQSYPSNDTQWKLGSYQSLLPYTAGIRSGLIDSFGYQGFPWVPPANQKGMASTNPRDFLRTDLARAAADALGVRDIWFNTGTFGRAHTADADELVIMKPAQRRQQLQGIVAQADTLQKKGYQVAVHLFAEDKSNTSEGIDWSYWQPGQASSSAATKVFQQFVTDATTKNIAVWIYDDDHKGIL